MPEPDTAAMPEPETKPRRTQETTAILGVGATLAAIIVGATIHMDNRIDNITARADADRRAFQAEAAADRRASDERAAADRRASDAQMNEFRTRMDEYRGHMQRLGERQARLEGQREGPTAE